MSPNFVTVCVIRTRYSVPHFKSFNLHIPFTKSLVVLLL